MSAIPAILRATNEKEEEDGAYVAFSYGVNMDGDADMANLLSVSGCHPHGNLAGGCWPLPSLLAKDSSGSIFCFAAMGCLCRGYPTTKEEKMKGKEKGKWLAILGGLLLAVVGFLRLVPPPRNRDTANPVGGIRTTHATLLDHWVDRRPRIVG